MSCICNSSGLLRQHSVQHFDLVIVPSLIVIMLVYSRAICISAVFHPTVNRALGAIWLRWEPLASVIIGAPKYAVGSSVEC
jgi:hypothetical protein